MNIKSQPEVWTFEAVEERLVQVIRLWRRSPGGGRWPFAADGPWHLVQPEVAIDPIATGGVGKPDDAPLRPLPLSCDEVEERDRVSEWVPRFVPPRDRRLVAMVLVLKAAGKTVSWLRLRQRFGAAIGSHGLRKRYARAINCICMGLNAAEISR